MIGHSFDQLCQIGVGDEANLEELKDVASEPHSLNIYMVKDVSALTQVVANRLTDALCNSKHDSISTAVSVCFLCPVQTIVIVRTVSPRFYITSVVALKFIVSNCPALSFRFRHFRRSHFTFVVVFVSWMRI